MQTEIDELKLLNSQLNNYEEREINELKFDELNKSNRN